MRYKTGRAEVLNHQLVFRQTAAPTALRVKANNWAREINPGWWEWGLHIEGEVQDLDQIRCVEYTLHRSFPKPVRTICTRQNRFTLTARGWGTFRVKIKLLLQNGTVQDMSHQLQFR